MREDEAGEGVAEQEGGGEDQVVDGPDAQDAADVEGADADCAALGLFLKEQVGDQEAAEHEEEAHARLAQGEDRVAPQAGELARELVVLDVVEEHGAGREHAQAVQAGELGLCRQGR